MNTKTSMVWLAAMILALAAATPAAAGPMKVFVSVVPQKYFVEQIGGDHVQVSVLVPPEANPHSYEPTPRQMVDLAESKIYFAIGVNLERVWLDKIKSTNPDLMVVHTEKNIDKIPMKDHRHDHDGDHQHQDHDGDHQHQDHDGDHKHQDHDAGILDPHVWTSPKRVMKMAPVIRDALIEADPANEADYRAGYEAFMAEVKALDAKLKEVLAGREGMKFMVFHPAWGYLAHDYGLVQVPVEIEGKEPKPAQLKELIERARTDGVKVVFVQPQLSTSTAEMVAKAIDGRVMHADPLAEDWAENLERQVAEFKAALH